MTFTPALAFLVLTLPFSLWAAWSDLSTMKIRNRFNLILFAVFLVSGLILLPLPEYGLRIAVAAAALVFGRVLFATGHFGGGDAKFIAAFIPFIDPTEFSRFAMIMAGCLLAAVLVHRVARQTPAIRNIAPQWQSWQPGKPFPMGLGLAAGFSATLAVEAFNLSFLPG